MKKFSLLYNDKEINQMIDSINDKYKALFMACHGRYHTDFVITTVEYILKSLSYKEKIVELGKIAGLFHDIGCVQARKGHSKISAEMCAVLLEKTSLSAKDREVIVQAVYDHSDGDNITSPVGAALLIADKSDVSKDRVLPLRYDDRWHRNLCEIEKMEIRIYDKIITINYITSDNFSKDILIEEWYKGIMLPIKAAEYLGCACRFEINGIETEFDL